MKTPDETLPVQLLVASAIAALGNPAVSTPARDALRIALRGYSDVLSDLVLFTAGHRDEEARAMVAKHNAAYAELAQAMRTAGINAAMEA